MQKDNGKYLQTRGLVICLSLFYCVLFYRNTFYIPNYLIVQVYFLLIVFELFKLNNIPFKKHKIRDFLQNG